MEPLTTFIIPTIGRSSLDRAVASLRCQRSQRFKILAVFDGVAPNSQLLRQDEILALPEKMGKLRAAGEDHNSGGRVRNKGLELVTTPWVSFLDDDDCVSDKYVQELELADRECDLYVTRMVNHNDHSIIPRPGDNFLRYNNVGINFSVRMSFVGDTRFINSPSEDWDFVWRLMSKQPRLAVSESILYLCTF